MCIRDRSWNWALGCVRCAAAFCARRPARSSRSWLTSRWRVASVAMWLSAWAWVSWKYVRIADE
eukprot:2264514-Alexandrium_andersonii.AAC.1